MADGIEVSLSPDQMSHATMALRLTNSGIVRVFNAEYGEWECKITDTVKRSVRCVSQIHPARIEKGASVACALINPKRFDFFLEKATELGIGEIIPIISQRTQPQRINWVKSRQKIIHACEQCRRFSVPVLREVIQMKDFLRKYASDYKILVGDERLSVQTLANILEEKCVFLVGPEGGFSDDEHNLFNVHPNVHKFTFGKNILRTETAAVVFTAIWGSKFI